MYPQKDKNKIWEMVFTMTQKELLYVEDALGHEQQLCQYCNECANQLRDPQLRSLVQGIASKHKSSFNMFYSLLNS